MLDQSSSWMLPAAAIFAAVFTFDASSSAFGATPLLGIDCEPRASTAMAFSPAVVSFSEYPWPVSSSRRQGGVKVTAAKSTCSATPVLREAIYAARARHSAKAAERLCL